MAFTLHIKRKGFLNNRKIDFGQILSNCKLKYGSDNDFYVLKEEEMRGETAILYNPDRIGRGIFFDGSRMEQGRVVVSYNIPSTETEIYDFINLVKEIERQYGKVEMYCEEEEQNYTVEELMQNRNRMVQFSLESLQQFCQNEEYQSYIFTLAMWPWNLQKEQVERFARCRDLKEFEQMLHEMQCMDVYYASPGLYRKDGKIGAYYVLTEECESIFPVKADAFINLDNVEIQEGFVRFYIFSEDKMIEDLFDYDKFIACIKQRGATIFDADHVRIPSLTKEEIGELIQQLS